MRTLMTLFPLFLAGCAAIAPPIVGVFSAAPNTASPNAALSHYMTARFLELDGDMEGAASHLRQAAEQDPKSVSLRQKLVRMYIRMERVEDALAITEETVRIIPNDATMWIVLGRIYQELERYDEAAEALTEALRLNPDNPQGYEVLARAQESSNDLIAVIDIYEKLIAMRPESAFLHFQLASKLATIKDNENALASVQRALDLNPQYPQALFLQGAVLMDEGRNEEAVSALNAYVSFMPQSMTGRTNLAAAHGRLGQYEKAVALLNSVIQQGNADPLYYLERAYALLRMNEAVRAEGALPPEGAPLLATVFKAIARAQRGLPFESLIESLDIIDGDTEYEISVYMRDLLYHYGADEAGPFLVQALDTLRQRAPESRFLSLLLGRVHLFQEHPEEAVRHFHEGLRIHPDDFELHYYAALANEELERFEVTEQHLKKCLDLEPADAELMNFLGYLYAERDMKLDEAHRLLTLALGMEPENGFYLDSLGWIYYQQGKPEKAIEYIRRAILAMTGDDAVVRDHLGDAYLLNGETAKAIAQWERAIRLDKTLEGVQEKIDKHRDKNGKSE